MLPGQYKKDKYEIKIESKNLDFDLNDPVLSR